MKYHECNYLIIKFFSMLDISSSWICRVPGFRQAKYETLFYVGKFSIALVTFQIVSVIKYWLTTYLADNILVSYY